MLLRAKKTFAGKYGLVRRGSVIDIDEKYARELVKVGAAAIEKTLGPKEKAVLPGPPRMHGAAARSTPASPGAGKASRSSVSLPGRASRRKTSKPVEGAPES